MQVHPEWNAINTDAVDALLIVFSFDSLTSSHPVYVPIDQANKISQIFDTISYKKGEYSFRSITVRNAMQNSCL